MKLSEHIQNKINELSEHGYKQVQLLSALNCALVKNGTYETFLTENSNLDSECYELKLGEIEEGMKLAGSVIRIWGVPKRKRKGQTINYYAGLKE